MVGDRPAINRRRISPARSTTPASTPPAFIAAGDNQSITVSSGAGGIDISMFSPRYLGGTISVGQRCFVSTSITVSRVKSLVGT
jgi:hypothetical protein